MEDTQKWGNELRWTAGEMLKSQRVQRIGIKFNKERKPLGKAEVKEKKAGDCHLLARSQQPINNTCIACPHVLGTFRWFALSAYLRSWRIPLSPPRLENQVTEAKARFRLRTRYREVMGVTPDLSVWSQKCLTLSPITQVCCHGLPFSLTTIPSTFLWLHWPPSCVLSLSETLPPHDLCSAYSSARMPFLQKLSGFLPDHLLCSDIGEACRPI